MNYYIYEQVANSKHLILSNEGQILGEGTGSFVKVTGQWGGKNQ